MLIGMTGFAQESVHFKEWLLNLEIRSLNHRFFECVTHLLDGLGSIEDLIKGQVRAKINRGRISVVLTITNPRPKVSVNYELAGNYLKALKQLNVKLKLEDNLSLSQITNMPGIISLEKIPAGSEMNKEVKELLSKALKKLIAAKNKEGRLLNMDVSRRIQTIKKEVEKINRLTKQVIAQKQKKLSGEDYGVFLKSTDIAEELTRIGYHVKNFQNTLAKTASYAKELDFIAQEIQREANTISAKAQDARVSSGVVVIKSSIDKIREQLQNAE